MERKMADLKSKLPDVNEIMSMMSKFYHGVKNSAMGIINDYKEKHNQPETPASIAPSNTQTIKEKETVAVKEKTTVVKAKKATPAKKPHLLKKLLLPVLKKL